MRKLPVLLSSTLMSSILAVTLLLTGCAISNQPSLNTKITGEVKAPLSSDNVSVYNVAPVSYAEIAKMSASTIPSLEINDARRVDEAVKLLQSEAAMLGANAIVLSNLDVETIEREYNTFNGTQGGRIKENRHIVHIHALAVYVNDK